MIILPSRKLTQKAVKPSLPKVFSKCKGACHILLRRKTNKSNKLSWIISSGIFHLSYIFVTLV